MHQYKRIYQTLTGLLVFASTMLVCINFDGLRMCANSVQKRLSVDESTHLNNGSDFQTPIIFIGGIPRSGTTLMRVMLDAHPDIRCGPETRIIPAILIQRNRWLKTEKEVRLLVDAGVLPTALDIAVASFILEVVKYHAPSAKNYCNKDPFVLADMTAVLQMWNNISRTINKQCNQLGEQICLPIKYETLVLRPIETTKRIFEFLEIPWRQEVIHHHQYVNRTKLSKYERSTNQVVRPIYLDALYSWVGKIPSDVENEILSIAPMLEEFGYNTSVPRPFYGYPEGNL